MTAKHYQGQRITVSFDPARCLHAAECVSNLPSVFDTGKRPWVEPDGAEAERIAEVIHMCPSGALHYESYQPAEPPDVPTRIDFRPGGPMFVRGDLRLTTAEGSFTETRAALCSCGGSGNAPFCDASGPCRDWKSAPA